MRHSGSSQARAFRHTARWVIAALVLVPMPDPPTALGVEFRRRGFHRKNGFSPGSSEDPPCKE
jgi:hypothetical protein